MTTIRIAIVVLMIMASYLPAPGGQPNDVLIHGTGGWAVGNSDPYEYQQGGGEGNNQWHNVDFMLNLNTSPYENLRIGAQLWYAIEGIETESELEVAFAEWTVSESLHFRGGLSRVPFGIYANIFDIGTLRPFYSLPQSIYGPVGMTPEGYSGIGMWGQAGETWQVVYDLYAGGMKVPNMEVHDLFIVPDVEGVKGSRKAEQESMV